MKQKQPHTHTHTHTNTHRHTKTGSFLDIYISNLIPYFFHILHIYFQQLMLNKVSKSVYIGAKNTYIYNISEIFPVTFFKNGPEKEKKFFFKPPKTKRNIEKFG